MGFDSSDVDDSVEIESVDFDNDFSFEFEDSSWEDAWGMIASADINDIVEYEDEGIDSDFSFEVEYTLQADTCADLDPNVSSSEDVENSPEMSDETVLDSDVDIYDGQISLFDSNDVQPEDIEPIEDDVTVHADDANIFDTEESNNIIEKQVTIEEYVDFQEDLEHTPAYDSVLGDWAGFRGDSTFIPSDSESQKILSEFGFDGVPYHDALPDFSEIGVATVYLSQEDMEQLGDSAQKEMANFTLASDLMEASDKTSEFDTINPAVIEAVLGKEVDEFYAALLSGEVPQGFVWHHGEKNDDGDYEYTLIPAAIHDACKHSGGRSHSSTKR